MLAQESLSNTRLIGQSLINLFMEPDELVVQKSQSLKR